MRIILFLFLLPTLSSAQNMIGKKKPQVLRFLREEMKKNDTLNIVLTDNDSVVLYSIKPGRSLPADFKYGFDKKGKCNMEQVVASCQKCYDKYLKELLEKKKFEWKKINENQYISNYEGHRMIELPSDPNTYTYTILHTDWDKSMYKMLLDQ